VHRQATVGNLSTLAPIPEPRAVIIAPTAAAPDTPATEIER
jgi:hypothetical protein